MAEEMETLDNLFSDDPSADGNSSADAGDTDPGTGSSQDDAPAGESTIDARLADLEKRYQRNTERLQGAEQSALTWKRQAEENERVTEQLAIQLKSFIEAQPETPPPEYMQDLKDMLQYEPDPAAAQRFYQRHLKQQKQQQPDEKYVTKADDSAREQREAARRTAIAAVVQTHPELGNHEGWQTFLGEVLPVYDTLKNDPAVSALYPEAPDGPNSIQVGGRTLDLRLLDRAATQYKGISMQKDTARNSPTQESGGRRQEPSNSPVVPRGLVEGPDALLAHPAVQQALQRQGWGANYKTQVERLLKLTPDAKKKEWSRGRP